MAKKVDGNPSIQPSIRVAPQGELRVYIVPEHELDILATGSSASLLLNFSLALLSAGVSVFVTLISAEFKSDRVYYSFLIFCLICLINGIVLLVLWFQKHVSTQGLLVQIKNRMPPPPGTQETPGGLTES